MSKGIVAVLAGIVVAFAINFGISFLLAVNGAEPLGSSWVVSGMIGCAVAAVIANVAGRRKVTMADAGTRAAALSMTPPAGQGMVVVYREGFMGKRNGVDVALDGQVLTQLLSPQFTAINMPPGRHNLNATLAGDMNAGARQGDAAFDIAAGQAIVFRIGLKMGLATGHVELTRIDDLSPVMSKVGRMKMVMAAT